MIRRGWYGESVRHSLAARGVRTSSQYLKRKSAPIKIKAFPHAPGKAYPINERAVKEVLDRQGDNVKGIKEIHMTEPRTAEEAEAYARYMRKDRVIRVFAQPKEEVDDRLYAMMKNDILPHEVGHHVALYKRKITDPEIEMAEARADAHAAGFDVEDSDVHKFRQDMQPIAYNKQKEFDFQDIKGEWVQKSVKGNPPFQKGCKNVQAKYTPRPDGTIRVENSCTVDGKKRTMVGKARKVGERELQVDFFPGIPFTAGEFKVKKYSGNQMTVKGGKYEWQLERKNKKRAYNYTPTYVAGDLPVIAADGVGTAGAATVALIPLAVTAGALYVGGKIVKKQYDSAKKSKKSKKSRKKSKK